MVANKRKKNYALHKYLGIFYETKGETARYSLYYLTAESCFQNKTLHHLFNVVYHSRVGNGKFETARTAFYFPTGSIFHFLNCETSMIIRGKKGLRDP